MSGDIRFCTVRAEFLLCIALDSKLKDADARLATVLFGGYGNYDTGACFPSQDTLARKLGKSKKTIGRAIARLEHAGYISVERGKHKGRASDYRPTQAALLHAASQRGKGSNIVPLPEKGGQICPPTGPFLSSKGGQDCPPNNNQEQKILEQSRRQRSENEPGAISRHFVSERDAGYGDWTRVIETQTGLNLRDLGILTSHTGRGGFWAPSNWPPDDPGKRAKAVSDLLRWAHASENPEARKWHRRTAR